METELHLTKEELKYLYTTLKNHIPQSLEEEVELYQGTFNKVEHEMIANRIFDLLSDLDCLEQDTDGTHYEEWENKLWYDEEEDSNTIMVKRNREMWTWDTVSKMEELVKQL